MSAIVRILNSQNVSNAEKTGGILKAGTVVKGRVISFNGGNSYSVTVAGRKIDVTSTVPLKSGMTFSATIGTEGNTVTLKLNQGQTLSVSQIFTTSSFDSNNPQVINLLNSLGLPASPQALTLLQFAIEMGIKPVPFKLNKAFFRGANEKAGKGDEATEAEKSQLALLLEEKGLSAFDHPVEALYESFHDNQSKNHQEEQKQQNQKEKQKLSEAEEIVLEEDSSYENNGVQDREPEEVSASDVRAYFDNVETASRTKTAGLLSLFNSIKAVKEDEKHWIVLPFEWTFNKYIGVIRVLLSENKKNIVKIVIDCRNEAKKYFFVLYFKGEKVNSIKAGVSFFSKNNHHELKNLFFTLLQEAKVQIPLEAIEVLPYEDFSSGFCTDDVPVPVFEGRA